MPNFIINVKEKGAKKAEKNVKGLNKALGGLKSKAMLAAGAFLGAGALVAGIKGAVNAFGEQELAEKKLEASLGRTSQALLDQAAALQQVSNFGDETIISAQALIAAFVDDEEQIKLATQATLDLAAAKGMDLNAAADLVSKTLGSSTNAMSRYGIEVEGAVGSTERLESLTGNIANKFGGQAKAQSETYTGTIKGMNDAIGDAAESMGALLSGPIMEAAQMFKGAAEAVDAYLASLRRLTPEEIKSSQNQEDLAERIAKTKKEMTILQQQITMGSSAASVALQKGVGGSTEKYEKLGNQLILLERQLEKLTTVKVPFVGTEDQVEYEKFLEQQQKEKELIEEKIKFRNAYRKANKKAAEEEAANKAEQLKNDLRNAALSGQTASQSMKSVVRAEAMKAVAKSITSIMGIFPFPFSLVAAAGAGGLVSAAIDRSLGAIPEFATGGDFVTDGPQLIKVGDNVGGAERVQITPLSSPNIDGPQGSVNITFNSPIMSADHTEEVIIPQIKEAIRRGADIGVS